MADAATAGDGCDGRGEDAGELVEDQRGIGTGRHSVIAIPRPTEQFEVKSGVAVHFDHPFDEIIKR